MTLAQYDALCERYQDEQYLTDVRVAKLCYYICAPYLDDKTTTIEDFMPENVRRDKKISSSEDVIVFLKEQAAILNSRPP